MRIDSESIGIRKHVNPNIEAAKTSVHRDPWAFAFTNAPNCTDYLVGFQGASERALAEAVRNPTISSDAQRCQGFLSDIQHYGLIEDTKHGNDVGVLRLADELRKDSNVIQGPLCVR